MLLVFCKSKVLLKKTCNTKVYLSVILEKSYTKVYTMKPDTNLYNAYKIAGVLFYWSTQVSFLKQGSQQTALIGLF